MFTFAQWLDDFLAKAVGHKYIKRIPYQSGGKLRYRYIYKVTHTHQGKHVLDPDHMKVGTKLMLDATSGKEVHGHIVSVNGDSVVIKYDDGEKKGQTRTVTKQALLKEFDQEHGASSKIDEARGAATRELEAARRSKASDKQLVRLEDRIKRLTREIESNNISQLQKDILRKHTVTAEMVEKHKKKLERLNVGEAYRPARLMIKRIDALTADGTDAAVISYNNALERAASDNQNVLTAIEAYQDMVAVSFSDPENMNRLVSKQAENLDYIIKEYGVTPEMTGKEAIQHIKDQGIYTPRFVQDMQERTGHDPSEENLTIDLMCGGLRSVNVIRDQLKLDKMNSELATRAREAIQEHITKACSDFSFRDMKYGEGDYHKNHKRDASKRTPRQREIMNSVSGVIAHAEDIFGRAYPERKLHKTKISVGSGDRAFAEMEDANKSTISLTGYDSMTAAHELAHTLEGNYGTRAPYQTHIQQAVTLTHLTRTGGNDVDLYGERREYALEDQYQSDYAGKVYADGSSELVTMGVQEFFDYKAREDVGRETLKIDAELQQMKRITDFAITDPHHYLVTYSILKGYVK